MLQDCKCTECNKSTIVDPEHCYNLVVSQLVALICYFIQLVDFLSSFKLKSSASFSLEKMLVVNSANQYFMTKTVGR